MPHFENEQLLSHLSDRIGNVTQFTLSNTTENNSTKLASALNQVVNRTVQQYSETEIANEFGLMGGTFTPDPPDWWVRFLENCSL